MFKLTNFKGIANKKIDLECVQCSDICNTSYRCKVCGSAFCDRAMIYYQPLTGSFGKLRCFDFISIELGCNQCDSTVYESTIRDMTLSPDLQAAYVADCPENTVTEETEDYISSNFTSDDFEDEPIRCNCWPPQKATLELEPLNEKENIEYWVCSKTKNKCHLYAQVLSKPPESAKRKHDGTDSRKSKKMSKLDVDTETQKTLDNERKMRAGLKKICQDFITQNEALTFRLEERISEDSITEEEIIEQQATIARFRKSNDDLIESHKKDLDRRRKEEDINDKKWSEKNTKLRREIDALKKEYEPLTAVNACLVAESMQLKQTIAEMSQEFMDSKEKLDKFEKGNFNPNCCICLTKRPNIMTQPCNHLFMCEDCAPQVKNCPICKEKIFVRIKAFLQ